MNNVFRFHPLERPKADSPNMLPNDERINPNIVPLERLRAMDEDTYEDVVAAWAYCCVKSEEYQEVYRVGGAGDKGRDVIAYIDRKNDIFDLLRDGARELKRLLKKDWNEHIKEKIGKGYGANLDSEMSDYIERFDYSIIRQVEPLKFIEDLRADGRYFFCYFGGGFSNIKRE